MIPSLPTFRSGLGLLAAALILLPAVAGVGTAAKGHSVPHRALAAWSAPEPMDYGQGAAPLQAAWAAPEPMDYGMAAYATLAQYERAPMTGTAVASR
jgi:hypothetical protein